MKFAADDFYVFMLQLPHITWAQKGIDHDAPIIRMLNALLMQAARDGASDIHIEAYERYSCVRFRIDGSLREVVNHLNQEVQRRAMQLATILEPLLIVTMGAVVMLIVLAVMLPIIQLNQFVR